MTTSIQLVSKFRFVPFVSATYNKVSVYSRASSQDIKNLGIKEIQNKTFVDWTSRFNTFVFDKINHDWVQEDIDLICEDYNHKICYNRHPSNMVLNKSIFLIIALIFLFLIRIRRIKYGLLPVLWFSYQLFFIYDIGFNLTFMEITKDFHVIGMSVALASLFTVVCTAVYFLFNVEMEELKEELYNNLFYDLFSSRKRMGEYFLVKFSHDICFTLVVLLLKDSKKIQAFVLAVLEFIYFIYSFRNIFKQKILKIREIVISGLFLILAGMGSYYQLTILSRFLIK